MAKPGPAPIFNRQLADVILERLSGGESLRSICQTPGMPNRVTVLRWVANDVEGFAALYDRAREMQAHSMAEDILDIADDGRNDWMRANAANDAGWVLNGENIQRSKLRYEARRWLASKIFPKQYGDRNVTEVSGPAGGPIAVKQIEDSTPSIRLLLRQALASAEPEVIDGGVDDEDDPGPFLKDRGSRPRLSS
jgi:hypothetical protein